MPGCFCFQRFSIFIGLLLNICGIRMGGVTACGLGRIKTLFLPSGCLFILFVVILCWVQCQVIRGSLPMLD